jgi:hypothetical protein
MNYVKNAHFEKTDVIPFDFNVRADGNKIQLIMIRAASFTAGS